MILDCNIIRKHTQFIDAFAKFWTLWLTWSSTWIWVNLGLVFMFHNLWSLTLNIHRFRWLAELAGFKQRKLIRQTLTWHGKAAAKFNKERKTQIFLEFFLAWFSWQVASVNFQFHLEFIDIWCIFKSASISRTYPCQSVRPSVGPLVRWSVTLSDFPFVSVSGCPTWKGEESWPK